MSAAKLNLLVEAGATFNCVLTWQDPDGDPIDITGYTAALQARATADAAAALVDLTSEVNGGITLGDTDGTIAIVIAAAATAALPTGRLVYDLELTAPGPTGDVVRLVEGSITVHRQVTRE